MIGGIEINGLFGWGMYCLNILLALLGGLAWGSLITSKQNVEEGED